MKKIVLDTNAYVHYLGGDEKVLNVLSGAEIIYFSVFVAEELIAGFRGGTKEKKNREYLELFLSKPEVEIVEASIETADIFGMIKNNLKSAGTPIPINDIWIAAHTMETGSMLVTFDRHFEKIAGLRLWK